MFGVLIYGLLWQPKSPYPKSSVNTTITFGFENSLAVTEVAENTIAEHAALEVKNLAASIGKSQKQACLPLTPLVGLNITFLFINFIRNYNIICEISKFVNLVVYK
jgi:hypothetical protein